MSITGSCGHEFTESEGLGTTVAIKAQDKECQNAISFPTVCDKCLKRYEDEGLILKTRKEQDEYFHNSK